MPMQTSLVESHRPIVSAEINRVLVYKITLYIPGTYRVYTV